MADAAKADAAAKATKMDLLEDDDEFEIDQGQTNFFHHVTLNIWSHAYSIKYKKTNYTDCV